MNILLILATLLITYASFKLFKLAAGSMSLLKFNTVTYVFYVQIITSGLVGSTMLALNWVDYHPDVQGISNDTKIEAWMWVMYSIIVMPITMIALNKVFKVNAITDFKSFLNKDFLISGTRNSNLLLIGLMILFSIAVIIYIFVNSEGIALYTLLVEGDAEQASIERVAARRNFHGISHIKNLLGLIMVPVFTFYVYILYRTKKDVLYGIGFLVLLLCSILLMTYDIQKAPIAFFILGFYIVEVVLMKGIQFKKLIFFVGIPVLLIIVGYSLTNSSSITSQLFHINSAFYGRVFLTSYFAFPLSLEYFPYHITEPTYAVGVPSAIIDQININSVESARLLKAYVHPESVLNGSGNLYSGYYMGEAWANYGYIGLISAPMVVGVVVQSVHIFLMKSVKRPLVVAFYTVVSYKWLLSAGYANFFYLKIIIWPIVLYFVFSFLIKKVIQ